MHESFLCHIALNVESLSWNSRPLSNNRVQKFRSKYVCTHTSFELLFDFSTVNKTLPRQFHHWNYSWNVMESNCSYRKQINLPGVCRTRPECMSTRVRITFPRVACTHVTYVLLSLRVEIDTCAVGRSQEAARVRYCLQCLFMIIDFKERLSLVSLAQRSAKVVQ